MNRGFVYRETVGRRGEGVPLLLYLAGRYGHSSADEWRERIAAGAVRVDG